MRWSFTHQVWEVLLAFLLAVATKRCKCQSIRHVKLLPVAHLKGVNWILQAA